MGGVAGGAAGGAAGAARSDSGCHLRTWGVEGCTSKGTESRKQHVAFYNSINVALHEIKGRGRSA